jgi:tRNA-splicing ligase RtcB (3'-phosphate/5'-hydroxy nucleic acid ligase)
MTRNVEGASPDITATTGAIDGTTLIAWGFQPGKWFGQALTEANRLRRAGADDDAVFAALQAMQPVETQLRTNGLAYGVFLDAEGEMERACRPSSPAR